MHALKLCLIVLVLVIGCAPFLLLCCSPVAPLPPGPVPEPEPLEDAGADAALDPVTDACLRAEHVLCALDCRTPTGESLCVGPTGVRFAARCRDEIARGTGWNAECLAQIVDCDQVNDAATGALCNGGAP